MITQKELDTYFRYDKETGKLFWKEKTSSASRITIGQEAGYIHSRGYRHVGFKGKNYKSHRLIWKIETGNWPNEIDHEDGNQLNNRISNLKDVTHSENVRNKAINKNNKSGCPGVFYRNRWETNITYNKKRIHLGCFDTLDEAIAVRKEAEVKYGFHKNHGRNI